MVVFSYFCNKNENFRLRSKMQFRTLLLSVLIVFTQLFVIISWSEKILVHEDYDQCFNESCGVRFNPFSPLINCSYL